MRIPNPCNRCSSIPLKFRCSDSYCLECPVYVVFFFADAYEQMSFDDLSPVEVAPMGFFEYELASVANERKELLE